MKKSNRITGGESLVKTLLSHHVDKAFGVAGESYLAVLDALYDAPDICFITNRQEGGAGFMAESYAKLTEKTGICFVTRGPGATNAAIAVHTAMQDSTPMILFVGQVATSHLGREAFQEIDYEEMFKPPIAKAVFQINKAEEISDTVSHAFALTQSGRKGPVVIALPEDILTQEISSPDTTDKKNFTSIFPPATDIQRAKEMLQKAKKPIMIVGGSGWNDKDLKDFTDFAETHNIPVATSFRRQDLFPHHHPSYVGELGTGANPEMVDLIRDEADLVIAVNTRLSEITSQGYTLISQENSRQKFIHIYPDQNEFSKVYNADLNILASPTGFIEKLKLMAGNFDFSDWRSQLNKVYQQWTTLEKTTSEFNVDMDLIFEYIRNHIPNNAIITTDAGNFSGWAQRYIYYGRPVRLLAPTSGAMGYGLPSAISASLSAPGQKVIGMMGDGGFMMTAQELSTAVAYQAKPIILLFNNGIYGTIRMHQARDYPQRKIGTELCNPDFSKLAGSYGIEHYKIEKTGDFYPVFRKALDGDQMILIEICYSPEQISTTRRLSDLENK